MPPGGHGRAPELGGDNNGDGWARPTTKSRGRARGEPREGAIEEGGSPKRDGELGGVGEELEEAEFAAEVAAAGGENDEGDGASRGLRLELRLQLDEVDLEELHGHAWSS